MTVPHRILYGADYFPEQWDAATFDDDLRLMQEAGMGMVSIGMFAWSMLEPAEGEYDFAWLDRVIEGLTDAGVAVDLATPSAAVPQWFTQRHPHHLRVDADGRREPGSTRSFTCPTSEVHRERSVAIAGRLAERYGAHDGVVLWHIGNEFDGRGCWCDRCSDAFGVWVRERYGSLDALNTAWGTAFWSGRYTDWAQVVAPRASDDFRNPSLLLSWKRFTSEIQLGNYLAQRAAIREHDASTPITTNFMGPYPTLDYAAWAQHIDVLSSDAYPDPASPEGAAELAFEADLLRGLGGGKPFIRMEQVTSAVQWREENVAKRPGQFALLSLQSVARGADAICQFQWRQSVLGAETFHGAMVPHAGRETRIWREVVALGEELTRIGDVQGTRTEADVALVFDWHSLWARESAQGPAIVDYREQLRAWHRACFELGITVDIVGPDAQLDGYRLVLVPGKFLLTEDESDRLRQVAEGGAIVVADALTGVAGQDLRVHRGGYLGAVAPWFGVRVLEHHPLGSSPAPAAEGRISSAIRPPATAVLLDGDLGRLDAHRYVEDLVADEDVDVVARFADGDLAGSPAVTRRVVGDGEAWYVGANLDHRSLERVVARLAEAAEAAVPRSLPTGVEAVVRGDRLFLLNHGDDAAGVDVERVAESLGRTVQGEAPSSVPPRTGISVSLELP